MEFIGRHKHRIDKKGRVSVPSAFRKILSEEYDNHVIISNGLNYLEIYPYAVFKRRIDRLNTLPSTLDIVEDYKRFQLGDATDYLIDELGRLLIPSYLREEAGLKEEVIIIGMADAFEIWDADTYGKEHQRLKDNFHNIKKGISEHGV